MINQEFCECLEFKISKTLSISPDNNLKSIWCDGILLPDKEEKEIQKTINDTRKIELTAFFGKNGQDRYKMIIHFGKKSISRNARNLDLTECIPNSSQEEWIIIDENRKEVQINLN